MDYQRIYNEIISRARKENRAKLKRNNPNYVYYENHHIIPRCMNGTDNEENLVLLTAREHYVMHKLLVYIYPRVAGLASAVFFLTHTGNQNNRRKISSRDYENAKKLIDDNIIEIGKKISKGKKGKKFTEKQIKSKTEKIVIALTPVCQDKENKGKGGGWRWLVERCIGW